MKAKELQVALDMKRICKLKEVRSSEAEELSEILAWNDSAQTLNENYLSAGELAISQPVSGDAIAEYVNS